MTEAYIRPGYIVKHFKADIPDPGKKFQDYLYQIVGKALDTETEKQVVVYRKANDHSKMFVRPLDNFLEDVDTTKYPNAKQQSRFEMFATGVLID